MIRDQYILFHTILSTNYISYGSQKQSMNNKKMYQL